MKHLSRLLVPFVLSATPVLAQDVGVSFVHGVNTFLETPYVPQIVPATGITVEAWITYDDAPVTAGNWRYPTLVRQNVAANSESYFLRVEANNVGSRTLRWKVVASNGVAHAVSYTFAAGQLNTWTHVAGTYDGVNTRLFVNGVVVAQIASGTGLPIRDLGGALRIGKGDDATGNFEVWSGSIDEVRIWPFGRTPGEVLASSNQKLFVVPGLVETWNLDGFLFDTSSNLLLTDNGGVAFTVNPLALSVPATPFAVGASTPGCAGDLRLSPTVPAMANTPFGVKCVRTTPNFPGIWAATFGVLPFGVNVFGFDLWVDPTVLIQIPATANGLGVMAFDYTLSGTEPPGFVFALQAIVLDACAPQQLAASDAMLITVQ